MNINIKDESYNIGKSGEDMAVQYLLDKGYSIIKRNFRVPRGEIDIIAKDNGILVFVEVKNYSYKNFYLPMYSITERKKRMIRRTAEEYLYRNDVMNNDCRFDFVFIYTDKKGEQVIELIQNAFM